MSTTHAVDTVVVGAGHAGLAVSKLLTDAGRDHVVLDRGRVGESWRSERWDSLHLLTPSWVNRLPGWSPAGQDPEGFLSARDFATSLEQYAASFQAPVQPATTVRTLRSPEPGRFEVVTDRGTWQAAHVVVATGPHGTPRVSADVARTAGVQVLPSSRYRRPQQLPPGGVLVVGASSSGVQIADELNRAGRDVVLAVGRHTRMPRRYRGMDAFWWLESMGRLARTIDEVPDAEAARREPSLQLVGTVGPGRAGQYLDLPRLQSHGVRLAGRLAGIADGVATFADALADSVAAADDALLRHLDAVDRFVVRTGLTREVDAPTRPAPWAPQEGLTSLALRRQGIGTVVLATGFRPDHSWIDVPVKGPDDVVRQYRGLTEAPGLYVVGQRFQHRRDSAFIGGARHDADAVVTHLVTGCLPATACAGAGAREDQA